MKASILYITGRLEPRLDWLFDGLAAQACVDDDLELVVIDLHGRQLAALERNPERVAALKRIRICTPKPNIWQGPFRVTSCDWWAKSSAINTALCLASHDYIACLDDRSKLGPDWLDAVRKGERTAAVICGSYDRLEDGKTVPDGRRTSSPSGRRNCGGGWLYGCTWALPLAWALDVNGFEEGCDGMGGEDYIFGLNLAAAGHRLDFEPRLFVSLERSSHASPQNAAYPTAQTARRIDKGISPHDKSHAALARFGKRSRTEFTPNLVELRQQIQLGGSWPTPAKHPEPRDWYDDQPIKEMA